MDERVRWTVRVSKDTDVAVRMFLAQRGMKKGDLAKFIEEAVRWRVLDQTVAETKRATPRFRRPISRPRSMRRCRGCAPIALPASADAGGSRHQYSL